jgi:type I restriction enzyme M protein
MVQLVDPACRSAGFLVEALDHILAKYSTETREVAIYGEGWEESKGFKSVEAAKKAIPNLQTYPRGMGDRLAKDDWKKLEAAIYGHDVSGQMLRVAQMNLVLYVVPRASIRRANLEDPIALVDELLALETNITTGLQTLRESLVQ